MQIIKYAHNKSYSQSKLLKNDRFRLYLFLISYHLIYTVWLNKFIKIVSKWNKSEYKVVFKLFSHIKWHVRQIVNNKYYLEMWSSLSNLRYLVLIFSYLFLIFLLSSVGIHIFSRPLFNCASQILWPVSVFSLTFCFFLLVANSHNYSTLFFN